jgi:hypothetical protein
MNKLIKINKYLNLKFESLLSKINKLIKNKLFFTSKLYT